MVISLFVYSHPGRFKGRRGRWVGPSGALDWAVYACIKAVVVSRKNSTMHRGELG